MKKTAIIAALALAAGATTAANAQFVTLDWTVNGEKNINVLPGQAVTVVGTASWTGPGNFGFANFKLNFDGANASDTLLYTGPGLGHAPGLVLGAQFLEDAATANGRRITALGGGDIETSQLPALLNPVINTSNPIMLFTVQFIAGDAGRTIDINSALTSMVVYADFMGSPAPLAPIASGATVSVIPAPGSVALLTAGGIMAARRRRR